MPVHFNRPSFLYVLLRVMVMACVYCFVMASAAQAQQSRAEEIAAKQAAKSTALTPNTPGTGERVLDWFEDHFTDPNTVYATFGGVYPSGGLAPGIGLRHAFGPARFDAGGAWSVRSYKLARTSLHLPELAGNKLEFETHARWVDATQVPFYGVGNDTLKDDRVSYGLRSTDVGAALVVKPVSWVRLGGGVNGHLLEDREGVGRRPSIELRHSPASAPGLFSSLTYVQSHATVALDWRESPGYTRRGGLYSVTLRDFRDSDDAFSFRRLDVDFRQFMPVLKEHWVFGVRALLQTTTDADGGVVPYYLLPSLGGNQRLRAYSDFRFQDKHLLLLGAEYRWLPSRILDMALFVDAGQVASERRDLQFAEFKTGYGIGVRFHGPTFTPLRIDVAHGREGFRVHFTGGVPF
jgi:hypothetical protein